MTENEILYKIRLRPIETTEKSLENFLALLFKNYISLCLTAKVRKFFRFLKEILNRLVDSKESYEKIQIKEDYNKKSIETFDQSSKIDHTLFSNSEEVKIDVIIDEDVKKLLPIIDSLLEKLPDEIVNEFANSKDFGLYEKVIEKYKVKRPFKKKGLIQ